MKRTAIRYINNEDGTVKITGIDNAATAADIKKEFGNKVWDGYRRDYPHYYGRNSDELFLQYKNPNRAMCCLRMEKDDLYLIEELASIVETIRKAGDRLIEIAKANPIEKIVLI